MTWDISERRKTQLQQQPSLTQKYYKLFIFVIFLIYINLEHGRARVAHCVTGRWRNVSHYCRPLRLIYVFWAQRSTCSVHRQHTVYANSVREKYIVRHWSSREASFRHKSEWGNWKRFPAISWFAHPWSRVSASMFTMISDKSQPSW